MKRSLVSVLLVAFLARPILAQSDDSQTKGKPELRPTWNEIQKKNDQHLEELKEKDRATWNRLRAHDILDAQEFLASFGYGTVFTATLE
jgi:hypothetical protein